MKDILKKLGIVAENPGVCCGVDSWIGDEAGTPLAAINPASNKRIATVVQGTARSYDKAVQSAQRAFASWRTMPARQTRRTGPRSGQRLARILRTPGRISDTGKRQDPQRRIGRSAGNDRYLRFRRWFVAATLRLDDALGAAGPPHVRTVAPRWDRSALSPPSTFRWRYGRGMRR